LAAIVLKHDLLRHLLALLFGCHHRRTSFPTTTSEGTYVMCLDCGRKLLYNWQEMKIEDRK
jgi:hypothetical protein